MHTLSYPVPISGLPSDTRLRDIRSSALPKIRSCADKLAVMHGKKLGLSPQQYLNSSSGMAAIFSAMNEVYGPHFAVSKEEVTEPLVALERSAELREQFIFDVQTHFVSDAFRTRYYLLLRLMAKRWNPELKGERPDLEKLRFANYRREMFELSDTKMAVLTSAPNDDPAKWFLHNETAARTRDRMNAEAGKRYMLCHALIAPHHCAWKEEFEYAISDLKPDAWKCYTSGAPFTHSKYPWRLDDEKLIYPIYERMVRAGIKNVCVHKGLLPPFYPLVMHGNWLYGKIDDVPKAARDWPQLNFIIYHAGLQHGYGPSRARLREAEESGYIPWVSELAAMPSQYGLKNLYAEIGSAFALSAVTHPRYCTAMLGTLIKGMGADHVLWGTDSVLYGSPQWQIEAFRRIEVPDDLRKKFAYPELGLPNGRVKRMIFGENAARLYNVKIAGAQEQAA